jgi:hypothetical protein
MQTGKQLSICPLYGFMRDHFLDSLLKSNHEIKYVWNIQTLLAEPLACFAAGW